MTTVIVGRSERGGWLIGSLIVLGVLVAWLWTSRLLGLPGVGASALAVLAGYVAWKWIAMFVGRPRASEQARPPAQEDSSSLWNDEQATAGSPSRPLPHVAIPFEISRQGNASTLFDALTEFNQDLVDQLTDPQPGFQKKITWWWTRRRVKRVVRFDRGLYEFKDAEIRRVSISAQPWIGCGPSQVDMDVSVPGSGLYQASLQLLVPCSNKPPEGDPRYPFAGERIELGPGDVWIDDIGRRFRLPIPVVLAIPHSNEDPVVVCLGTRSRPFRDAGSDGL
jgi:hypothetical protein